MTEKFSDYLATNHFTVLTDNNPLTYILSSAKLDATGQRWASALGEFKFDIFYRAGAKNTDADAMSRYPFEKVQDNENTRMKIKDKVVKSICSVITIPYCEILPAMNINIVEVLEEPGQTIAQIEVREIRKRQREDYTIEKWRRAVIDQVVPTIKL